MAWVLRREDSTAIRCLLANEEHTVGRRDTRIVLDNDQSISRKHATISISFPEGNTSKPTSHPVVMLKDLSKYGTTVNGKKANQDGVILNSGDLIKFGVLENKWRITYEPFICSSSGLEKSDKANIRQQLAKIGGHIINEWSPNCNLLIMNKLSVSIKVVSALVSQRSIVTFNYLVDLVKALGSDSAKPDPMKFVPHFDEPVLIEAGIKLLEPNARRLSLLKGKTFVTFSAKQLKKLEFPIKQAGGSISLHDDISPSSKLMSHNGTCVIQSSSEGPSRHLITCLEELKRLEKLANGRPEQGKRAILEAEIGLAIIFCSTETYCNPENTSDVDKMHDNMSLAVSQMSTFESQSQSVNTQLYSKKCSSKTTVDDSAPTHSMSVIGNASCNLFVSRVAAQPSSSLPQSIVKEEVEDIEMDDHEPTNSHPVSHTANDSSRNVVLETKEEDLLETVNMVNSHVVADPSPPPPVLTIPEPDRIANGSVLYPTVRTVPDSVEQICTRHQEKRPLSPAATVFAGFLSTRNNFPDLKRLKTEVDKEDEVPVKCVIMVSQQKIHLSATAIQTRIHNGNNKNFKPFKKVMPRFASIIHNDPNHSREREDDLDACLPNQRRENKMAVHNNDPSTSSARKRTEAQSTFPSTQYSYVPDDDSDDGASAFE